MTETCKETLLDFNIVETPVGIPSYLEHFAAAARRFFPVFRHHLSLASRCAGFEHLQLQYFWLRLRAIKKGVGHPGLPQ